MIKRILKGFLAVFTALTAANAADVTSQATINEQQLFKGAKEISGECKPQCRQVSDDYISLVVGFNPRSGVTECIIVTRDNLEQPLSINANTINSTCIKETNEKIDVNNLTSSKTKAFDNLAKIEYSPNQLTFSKFISGVLTLDPNMINFETTKSTGILHLKDPKAIYGTNSSAIGGKVKKDDVAITSSELLNKANLAYYANLYSNMTKIYTALQYGLLVVIGGWFFTVLAIKNSNEKLENATSKQKVLNTLLIPVLTVAAFFVPIPEEAKMTATPVQKLMRAGAAWSNDFADRAAVVGAQSYTQKLFSSVGGVSLSGEKLYKENDLNFPKIIKAYSVGLNECRDRFPDITSFLTQNTSTAGMNLNKKIEKYTFSGCREIEKNYIAYNALKKNNDIMLEAVKKNLDNQELTETLKQINESIDKRSNELGWVSSTLMAGTSVLISNISELADNDAANQIMKNTKDLLEEASEDKSSQNISDRNTNFVGSGIDRTKQALGDMSGTALSLTPYLMLPGASSIAQTIEGMTDGAINLILDIFASKATGVLGKVKDVVTSDKKSDKQRKTSGISGLAGYVGAAYLYKVVLDYVPFTVGIVAGALAFISYVIELAKFYYISPFVTAFSVTMGKTSKVVDFLVGALAIFFKPILIVIFIYFGLFVYGIFKDIFLLYAEEQMNMMYELQSQFFLTAMLHIFMALLHIIGAVGASYMLWKIILHAPTWVLKMIGLSDSGANFASQELARNLERHTFQM